MKFQKKARIFLQSIKNSSAAVGRCGIFEIAYTYIKQTYKNKIKFSDEIDAHMLFLDFAPMDSIKSFGAVTKHDGQSDLCFRIARRFSKTLRDSLLHSFRVAPPRFLLSPFSLYFFGNLQVGDTIGSTWLTHNSCSTDDV